jgi:hypothetical protein
MQIKVGAKLKPHDFIPDFSWTPAGLSSARGSRRGR